MNFKAQSEQFISQIQTRKRNPAKAATVAAYQSYLTGHILPFMGEKDLSQVENGLLKAFVSQLTAKGLSTSSINGIIAVVKSIVSSAVDENGNELYPRKWNNDFIDLPVVNQKSQKAPVATPETVQQALGRAIGQDKALYALLAGSGLRIGEALSLMVGDDDGRNSFWVPETGTLIIRTTATKTGTIQSSPKTEAGIRQVDLHPQLNEYLKVVLKPTIGLVFKSENGGLVRLMTAYEHLNNAGVPGFHSFRRFRVTQLRKQGIPEGLVQFWTGHAGKSITDRYDKIGEDVSTRKQLAVKAGLGFQLGAM